MRKVIVSTLMTLDGKFDPRPGWTIPFDHEDSAKFHSELLAGSDGLILGRVTYQMFAALWPPRVDTTPYAAKINSMPKYVVSDTLGELEWENSHLVAGGVAEGVAKLKEQDGGDLVVYGGQTLIRGLQEHGLIDEYRFLLHPVVLGNGTSFVDGGGRVDLELVEATTIASNVLALTYRPVR
jgi:dihydrofolate reductase